MYLIINLMLIIFCSLYMLIEPMIIENTRRYVIGAVIFVGAVLYAFRPQSTKDTIGYINSFVDIEKFKINGINLLQKYNGYEYGYIILMKVFKSISSNYRIFFFCISLFGLGLTIYALYKLTIDDLDKNGEELFIALECVVALYISNYGFLYNGISVRAGLSIGLGLLFVVCILKKHIILATITFIIGFSFQRTIVVFLIISLILCSPLIIKKRFHAIIWATLGVVLFSGLSEKYIYSIVGILEKIITRYKISGYGSFLATLDFGIGLRDIYVWLLYGLLIAISNDDSRLLRFLNIVMVGAFVVVFMHDVRAVSRVYDLFMLFSIPIIANYYVGNTNNHNILYQFRGITTFAICCIGSVLMLKLCFY